MKTINMEIYEGLPANKEFAELPSQLDYLQATLV